MKQESKQKKNVGTSVMGNDIETTQNTMHVLDENKVLKKSYEDVVYISQPFGATSTTFFQNLNLTDLVLPLPSVNSATAKPMLVC